MQCAKPLMILSVTLAATNDIQTPASEVLNKASFAYGSTLGLQRSRKLTQSLVDSGISNFDDASVQFKTMKDNKMPTKTPTKETGVTKAVNQFSSSLGLADVSALGLQRSFSVTKRAAPESKRTAPVDHNIQNSGNPMQPALGLEDVSVLGLQRSFTITKRAASNSGKETPTEVVQNATPDSPPPLAENPSSVDVAGNTRQPALGLEDVSVLGLQRSFTVTKRASIPKEDPKTKDSVLGLQRFTSLTPKVAPPTEDSVVEGAPDIALSAVNPREPALGLEDVSVLGLQRSFTVTKRASPPKEDTEMKESVLGLQRLTSLAPKVAPPTEDSAVEIAPDKASSAAAGVSGASLLGRQQWTHRQSPATEDATDSKDKIRQSNQEANLTGSSRGSLLGLQQSWELSRRTPVVDDHQVSDDSSNLELGLSFEDVSVLGLQRSAQFKSEATGTITASKDAMLGPQSSKKLSRGQAAPVEDDIESMVVEV